MREKREREKEREKTCEQLERSNVVQLIYCNIPQYEVISSLVRAAVEQIRLYQYK